MARELRVIGENMVKAGGVGVLAGLILNVAGWFGVRYYDSKAQALHMKSYAQQTQEDSDQIERYVRRCNDYADLSKGALAGEMIVLGVTLTGAGLTGADMYKQRRRKK